MVFRMAPGSLAASSWDLKVAGNSNAKSLITDFMQSRAELAEVYAIRIFQFSSE